MTLYQQNYFSDFQNWSIQNQVLENLENIVNEYILKFIMKVLVFLIFIQVYLDEPPNSPTFDIRDKYEEHNDKATFFSFLKFTDFYFTLCRIKLKLLKRYVCYFLELYFLIATDNVPKIMKNIFVNSNFCVFPPSLPTFIDLK